MSCIVMNASTTGLVLSWPDICTFDREFLNVPDPEEAIDSGKKEANSH